MPETVLIIDDASSRLRAISRKLGYHVVTASNREEAVQWILSGWQPFPDLILLNLSMPDTAGLQMIREIKSSHPQLPVITLVPYGDEDCAAQVVQAGVTDFLSKPVTFNRLKLSLCNALLICRLWRMVEQLQDGGVLSGYVTVLFDEQGRIKTLRSIEEALIRLALRHNNGCMTRAARQLGIGRSTLYRRISEIEG